MTDAPSRAAARRVRRLAAGAGRQRGVSVPHAFAMPFWLRASVVVAAVISLLVTMFSPGAASWMLMLTGFAAGFFGAAAAVLSDRNDRLAWAMLGGSQLLNGLGNYHFIARDRPGWWDLNEYLVSWLFLLAPIVMVIGLWAFISPSRGWRPVLGFSIDLLIINGCTFVVAWSLGLGELLLDEPIDPTNLPAVMNVVALSVDLLGVAMFPALVRSRPGWQAVPVMLGWLALVSALIGDNEVTTAFFRLSGPVTPYVLWTLSSLLVMVGSVLVPRRQVQTYQTEGRFTFDLALVLVIVTAVLATWDRLRDDPLVTTIFTLALTLLLARALQLVVRHRKLTQQLADGALTDALTGLANRACFDEALRSRLEATGSATVLFCDLDGFKEVNDTHGHGCGDRLLVAAGERLGEVVGGRGLVARMGGDEFTVLTTYGLSRHEVSGLVEQVRAAFTRPVALGDLTISVSITVGVTYEDTADSEGVLMHADLALYSAKADGRRGSRVYEPGMGEQMSRRFALVQRFREALAEGEFTFDYQAIVAPEESGPPRRLEALIRWRDDSGAPILSPPEILESAAYLGEMRALTEHCVRRVVRETAVLHGLGVESVSLNMNAQQLSQPDLVELLQSALDAHAMPASLITVEVTEDILVESDTALRTLERLRENGIGIALDDFGTGFSNFSHIVELPIDQLKIDQSFTSTDPVHLQPRRVVLQSVVELAHELGLSVTLEGVETLEQFDLARSIGVEWIQGYLRGRPQPFETWLRVGGQGSAAVPTQPRPSHEPPAAIGSP
ncbi:MAG: putative bifunctional diguanylate cyclase/phosphodiesterase [Actinomycetales bacterium]